MTLKVVLCTYAKYNCCRNLASKHHQQLNYWTKIKDNEDNAKVNNFNHTKMVISSNKAYNFASAVDVGHGNRCDSCGDCGNLCGLPLQWWGWAWWYSYCYSFLCWVRIRYYLRNQIGHDIEVCKAGHAIYSAGQSNYILRFILNLVIHCQINFRISTPLLSTAGHCVSHATNLVLYTYTQYEFTPL